MSTTLDILSRAKNDSMKNAYSKGLSQGISWAQLADWELVRYAVLEWNPQLDSVNVPSLSGVTTIRGYQGGQVCGDRLLGDIFKQEFVNDSFSCPRILSELQSEWIVGWLEGVRAVFEQAQERD